MQNGLFLEAFLTPMAFLEYDTPFSQPLSAQSSPQRKNRTRAHAPLPCLQHADDIDGERFDNKAAKIKTDSALRSHFKGFELNKRGQHGERCRRVWRVLTWIVYVVRMSGSSHLQEHYDQRHTVIFWPSTCDRSLQNAGKCYRNYWNIHQTGLKKHYWRNSGSATVCSWCDSCCDSVCPVQEKLDLDLWERQVIFCVFRSSKLWRSWTQSWLSIVCLSFM